MPSYYHKQAILDAYNAVNEDSSTQVIGVYELFQYIRTNDQLFSSQDSFVADIALSQYLTKQRKESKQSKEFHLVSERGIEMMLLKKKFFLLPVLLPFNLHWILIYVTFKNPVIKIYFFDGILEDKIFDPVLSNLLHWFKIISLIQDENITSYDIKILCVDSKKSVGDIGGRVRNLTGGIDCLKAIIKLCSNNDISSEDILKSIRK